MQHGPAAMLLKALVRCKMVRITLSWVIKLYLTQLKTDKMLLHQCDRYYMPKSVIMILFNTSINYALNQYLALKSYSKPAEFLKNITFAIDCPSINCLHVLLLLF